MKYDRPFKTIEEQLNLLEERNLTVTEESYANDINTLKTIPYHSLINGYKHLFQSKEDLFKPNVTLDIIKLTYVINSELNNMLLNNIIHIEKQFKNIMSYQIARNYGVVTNKNPLPLDKNKRPKRKKIHIPKNQEDYLSSNHYLGKYVIETLKKLILMVRNPYQGSLIHHYVETKNHVPPWILMNDLSFGTTIKWYRILRGPDKKFIYNSMLLDDSLTEEEKAELFIKSMMLLKQFRNTVAHGNKTNGVNYSDKLPNCILNKIYIKYGILTTEEWSNGIGKNDITAILLMIIILLNDLSLATKLYYNVVEIIELNDACYAGMDIYEILNLPKDIINKLEKAIFYKYKYTIIK